MSIADQAMLSGANFLLNILVARWLAPTQYGAFSISYSVFLLLGTFHNAILSEPMLVFGGSRYAARFRAYLGALIRGHFLLMGPVGLILLSIALVVGRYYSTEMRLALLGLACSGPVIMLMWLARRAFYARLEPGRAALGGAAYLLLLLTCVFLLKAAGALSQGTAFLAMGFGSLLVSLFFLRQLRPQLFAMNRQEVGLAAAEHWRYGRWALATAGLTWIPGNIYYALIPAWGGLEAAAGLRALTNMAMPALHAISALSLLVISQLTRSLEGGTQRMARTMKSFLAPLLGGLALYSLSLILFREQAFRLLYGGRYVEYSGLVPLVSLLPMTGAVTAVVGGALRAMERPDRVFWCYVASNLVAVVLGILLTRTLQIKGALLALLFSSATTAVAMLLSYRNAARRWGSRQCG